MLDWKRVLCRVGIHDWSRLRSIHISGSNIREWERYCRRCGKREKRIEII